MHNPLGEFIRAHRERLTPAAAGLPGGGRRRTPGLRREELAQLCEVSPTWLTWLEQGREVSPSARMLARLAQVLQLSPAERGYLFGLADKLDPAHDAAADSGAEPGLAAVVEAIAAPAYILDRQWDAVAWNAAAGALFAPWLARLDGAPVPNLLRFMFSAPEARGLIVDWPDRAARLVAEFRADCGRHADQAPLAGLIAGLARDSADFQRLWTLRNVVGREGGARRFQHPQRGALDFEQVTLHLAKRHDLKLVMLLPQRQP
ncbi:helix-turn-helix transcriptional regulator [Rugamonas rubra]|uniref:Helix-turn-helix domain-containing protein n=1 Tax=Rugamonas rubra TaxID=758825 RepID=A0A1I4N4L5_9BURK|nr:helix-turn-helix transcriptional regulator [Rugamonas rubra]SFM10257.1 Helix-turn-helix domain-containing protein [Rugamonas rubra]